MSRSLTYCSRTISNFHRVAVQRERSHIVVSLDDDPLLLHPEPVGLAEVGTVLVVYGPEISAVGLLKVDARAAARAGFAGTDRRVRCVAFVD